MIAGFPVYIVDSDSGMRQHLVGLLRQKKFAPVPFSSGTDFLESLTFLAPGIVLLELQLTEMTGFEVQQTLLSRRQDILVVAMSAAGDIPTAVHVIKHGAFDFLEKPFTDKMLFKTLANARPLLEDKTCAQSRKESARTYIDRLTKRELDVMCALKSSDDNRIVADRLNLSIRTVEMHRSNIIKKFEVSKFTEVLRMLYDLNRKENELR